MKKTLTILSLALIFLVGNVFAQDSAAKKNQYRKGNTNQVGFVDADGDGIPNGMDEDYTGAKNRKGNNSKGFVDENGDGINDNALDADDDGIPKGQDDDFVRPQDGSGNKRGSDNSDGNSQGKRHGGKNN